jgi:hypothetical protein
MINYNWKIAESDTKYLDTFSLEYLRGLAFLGGTHIYETALYHTEELNVLLQKPVPFLLKFR